MQDLGCFGKIIGTHRIVVLLVQGLIVEIVEKLFQHAMGLDAPDALGETPAHPPAEDPAQDFSESSSDRSSPSDTDTVVSERELERRWTI